MPCPAPPHHHPIPFVQVLVDVGLRLERAYRARRGAKEDGSGGDVVTRVDVAVTQDEAVLPQKL